MIENFPNMSYEEKISSLLRIESIKAEDIEFLLNIGENHEEEFDVRMESIKIIGIYGEIKDDKSTLDRLLIISQNSNEDEYVRVEAINSILNSESSFNYIENMLGIVRNVEEDIDVRYAAFSILVKNKSTKIGLSALESLRNEEIFGKSVKNEIG